MFTWPSVLKVGKPNLPALSDAEGDTVSFSSVDSIANWSFESALLLGKNLKPKIYFARRKIQEQKFAALPLLKSGTVFADCLKCHFRSLKRWLACLTLFLYVGHF